MTNRHSPTPSSHEEDAFAPILDFVRQARGQALAAVNRELVALYWRIGEYLNHKIAADGWGQGTIKRLADWLVAHEPGIRGYSPQNIWRMRQFHETYREDAILSPAVRELSWTHNLVILSKCRSQEERDFYLRLAIAEMAEFIATPVKRYNSGMTAQPITLSETQCQSYTNTSA